jgi:hypothetical protein
MRVLMIAGVAGKNETVHLETQRSAPRGRFSLGYEY